MNFKRLALFLSLTMASLCYADGGAQLFDDTNGNAGVVFKPVTFIPGGNAFDQNSAGSGSNISVAAVPEPSAIALGCFSLVSFGMLKRMRRRRLVR
jgi:hypothetical protein